MEPGRAEMVMAEFSHQITIDACRPPADDASARMTWRLDDGRGHRRRSWSSSVTRRKQSGSWRPELGSLKSSFRREPESMPPESRCRPDRPRLSPERRGAARRWGPPDLPTNKTEGEN